MESQINYKNITIKPSAYCDDFDFKNFLDEYRKSLARLGDKQMADERSYRSRQMVNFPTTVNVRMNLVARDEMIRRGLERGTLKHDLSQREF